MLVVVLLVTGVLVDKSPGPDRSVAAAVAGPAVSTGTLGDVDVRATMSPAATGPSTVTIAMSDSAGEPFEGFEAPRARLASDAVDLGDVPVQSVAPGTYSAQVVLPSARHLAAAGLPPGDGVREPRHHPRVHRRRILMSRPRHLRPYVVAVLLVVVTALVLGAARVPDRAAAAQESAPTEADGRTWLVDAIDDFRGNRWESVDTRTSEVTIQAGDTVEWRFDFAAQEHDLTSQDTGTAWEPAIAEYRVPGDVPVRYTFDKPGTYEYICSIHGTLMRGTVVVEEAGNRDPVATPVVDPTSGAAPLLTHFTANATDPDGDPLTYRWDFGTGEQATTAHAMHSYTVPGTYTATLEVSDGHGGLLEEEFAITVSGGAAPFVTAAADPVAGLAPLTVAFTGEATDAQGGELDYHWDFGVIGTSDDDRRHVRCRVHLRRGRHLRGDADRDRRATAMSAPTPWRSSSATARASQRSPRPRSRRPVPRRWGVAFSTAVTTSGDFVPFADGSTTYPDLTGTAELVRRRGGPPRGST